MLSGEQLVYLPGLDGTGISFEPLRQFVAADADVTVVRYPVDKFLAFDEIVECAARQVGTARDAVVVAESFSGPVAVELVGSGRLKAKCLVLCATFARSPRPFLLGIGRRLPLAAVIGLPLPELLLRYVLGGAEFYASVLPLWQQARNLVPPRILAQRLDIVSRVDVRRWLPSLTLPCCYIQAADDVVVPAAAAQDFLAGVPDLKFKSLRGPHFLFQARPEESALVIEDFVHLAARARARAGGSA